MIGREFGHFFIELFIFLLTYLVSKVSDLSKFRSVKEQNEWYVNK